MCFPESTCDLSIRHRSNKQHPPASRLQRECHQSRETSKVPIWKVREWVCTGYSLCLFSGSRFMFLNSSLWSSELWSETGSGWVGAAGKENASPSYRALGLCVATTLELLGSWVYRALMIKTGVKLPLGWYEALSCASLAGPSFYSLRRNLGKHRGKLGRSLYDVLHLWFHLTWPDCAALGE